MKNRRLGYVQITTSAETPQSAINQRWLGLGTAFLAFSIIGVIITIWLLNSLTRPLDSLRKSALQIADGDLGTPRRPLPLVEFDTVGTAFNTMAERVSALVEEQHAFASNASHELRTPRQRFVCVPKPLHKVTSTRPYKLNTSPRSTVRFSD